ncbi:MAG: hypothetical protein ACE5FL_08715 [Myxococcota bacterium]
MERETVERWIERHPGSVHGDVRELVSRCERSVRRHAREDAWLAAKRALAKHQREWQESPGAHASEAYVAQEICQQLAWDLRHHEPAPHRGDEDHLAGGVVKSAIEPDGWEFLARWIMDLAREEEHRTWSEIVKYTQHRARHLIRSHHLSDDCSFDHSKCYGEVALRIAGLLAHDYSTHAFPR